MLDKKTFEIEYKKAFPKKSNKELKEDWVFYKKHATPLPKDELKKANRKSDIKFDKKIYEEIRQHGKKMLNLLQQARVNKKIAKEKNRLFELEKYKEDVNHFYKKYQESILEKRQYKESRIIPKWMKK